MAMRVASAALAMLAAWEAPAGAAAEPPPCPVERAVFGESGGDGLLRFAAVGRSATASNAFTLALGEKQLQGIVQWTDEPARRPFGTLFLDCPEGDVTGEELAACTVWDGVVYALGADGAPGLMPGEGKAAPRMLILSGLGPALAAYPAFRDARIPSDVFAWQECAP